MLKLPIIESNYLGQVWVVVHQNFGEHAAALVQGRAAKRKHHILLLHLLLQKAISM
jgi:hypothetical protein